MRIVQTLGFIVCLATSALPAFGQGVNGTITGTISDPSGSVVAAATVEAANVETGALYTAASTNTGNYAIPNLPVGTYIITAKAPGFKTYSHTNLAIAAGQVLKEDVPLQVGAASESVTVSAEASLLKTESGETSHNVTLKELDELPLLVITGGYRNPLATLTTLPGSAGPGTLGALVVNGLGGNGTNAGFRIEGQDSSNRVFNLTEYPGMSQANVDAIQEISYQTSNYAPEFGQGGGMVVNMTMKSGTNLYHGSAFEYFVNEDLNAGNPFSISGGPGSQFGGSGGKFRPVYRRHDWGGTLGGPVVIPKLYNGKDKTFFQWSYEHFKYSQLFSFNDTVPTPAFRNGDFSGISPNGTCSLCASYQIPTGPLGGASYVDALGRPMLTNTVYDPLTRATLANGLQYANPFPNNQVPATRFNQTALAMQALFPNPSNTNLASNYNGSISGGQWSHIPTLKIDQIISSKDKLSFYWSRNNVETQINTGPFAADGLPLEIGQYRGGLIPTNTWRLNYDRTLTPTILFHFGAGYLDTIFNDQAPFLSFNPDQFGLTGFIQHRQFPSVTGMLGAAGTPNANYGGMQNIGTSGQLQSWIHEERPTFNANATWVKGAHRYKAGAEYQIEGVIGYNADLSGVTLATGVGPTSQPFQPSVSFNNYTQGFGYASFLLGDFTSINQTPNFVGVRNGYQQWGLFVQDSWKVTRKLTLDYGVRWDYATQQREEYGRLGQLDPTTANPNAGGRLGAIRYASSCNCDFYKPTYPFAIGPRIGVAYQLNPKTVLRGGWGVSYQYIAGFAGTIVSTPGNTPIPVQPNASQYINVATPGSIITPQFPTANQFAWPIAGTTGAPPGVTNGVFVPDANENRPPRISNWSVGFQREITRNFVVEASYVANRAAWLQGPVGGTGPLGLLSQISPQKYAQYGLYPYPGTGPCTSGGGVCSGVSYNNDSDRNLLTQPLSSAAVQTAMTVRGFPNFLPYSGFPLGNSLQSALYPFPQFTSATGTAIGVSGSPTGNSRYDSLQIKATKRLSHNLQGTGSFTWGQGFNRASRQDFFNPASAVWALQNYPPLALTFDAIYTVPKATFLPKWANALSNDWQLGWYSRYQSAAYLTPPTSPTANFLSSEDIRVPGASLYAQGVDINGHSTFNAYYSQVLNPGAWQACPTNSVCPATAVLYKDFRGPRIPSENANIGRHFRIGKEGKYDLYIRGEFVNIFNRTLFAIPTGFTSNPQNAPVKGDPTHTIYTSGFGVFGNSYLTPNTAYQAPGTTNSARTGTIIARFQF